MNTINIAIDGPAGAGKSTIARMVSAEMGYIYVDTGAMYRAVALYIIENNISDEDIESVMKSVEVSLGFADGIQRVYLGDRDVSDLIRTPEISMAASRTSAIPAVRARLFDLQQKLARENNIIMDGRDIGTCVLPDAKTKIYLTASADERARRRYKEQKEKGISCDLEKIKQDIIKRDRQDMDRETSPLKQAEDAVLLDSSHMTVDEVVDAVIALCEA